MTSRPSASLSVMMARSASFSIRKDVSTSLPSTLPASAALARPAPMLAATCATVTGPSNSRAEPSGRRTESIKISKSALAPVKYYEIGMDKQHYKNADEKKRGLAAFSSFLEQKKSR